VFIACMALPLSSLGKAKSGSWRYAKMKQVAFRERLQCLEIDCMKVTFTHSS